MSQSQSLKLNSNTSQDGAEMSSQSNIPPNDNLPPHDSNHSRRAANRFNDIDDADGDDDPTLPVSEQLGQMQLDPTANSNTSIKVPATASVKVTADTDVDSGRDPDTDNNQVRDAETDTTPLSVEGTTDGTTDGTVPTEQAAESSPPDAVSLSKRVDETEAAATALGLELAGVVHALKTRAEESARATLEHSRVVARASDGVKEGVKALEQSTMDMLRRAAEVRAQIAPLRDLARAAEKVRRELFYLEIDATRLRNHAVKRMARAASAKSARAVQKGNAQGDAEANAKAQAEATSAANEVNENEIEMQQIPSARSNNDPTRTTTQSAD